MTFPATDKDGATVQLLTGAELTAALGALGTQATLASLLAKVIAAPATEAKQDAANTLLTTQAGYLDGIEGLIGATNTALAGLGTQTTLAAILAKMIAAPATESTLATLATQTTAAAILAKLSSDPATQTTLAAVLAKLSADPATATLQGTANTLLAAATPAGELHIGEVGGNSAVPTANFNRPADTTAYASGDLVANSTTAGSVTPLSLTVARKNGGSGVIRRVRLSTTKTGLAGTEVFRVHLFTASPTVTNGDNVAFAVNGRAQGYLGYVDVTLASVFTDGACGFASADIVFVAGGGAQIVYALIEARGAYTPASGETFALALETLRD